MMAIVSRTFLLLCLALCIPASAASAQSTLVMPFELEKFDARVAWLAEGVAIGLTAALAERGVPVVSRDERLAVFERLQLPPAASVTHATVIKVAELAGATRVVIGRAGADGSAVTIEARVLQVDTAELGAPATLETPVSALFEAFRRAAARVSGGPAPAPASARPLAPSVVAFELFVRGLVARTEDAQERLLVQAIDAAPGYVEARLALWDVQTARGAHEQAAATIRPAVAARPSSLDAQLRAATSLVQLRRYDDAYAALNGLTADPGSAVVANLLGVVQLRRGWTPQTGRPSYYFNRAVELDPADADYCFNLGYAYWQDKDPLAAAYWLREAVRRDPTDGDAHYVLAAALAASGAGPEAGRERELARRLSARWESATPGGAVPRGLERLKDREQPGGARVDSTLMAGAQRDQRDASAFHLDAARRAFEAGRDPETIREAQRALYLTPYDSSALLLLGQAFARSGLLQEAVGAFKIAIWSAETPAAHVALGDVLLRLRDIDGAARAADRALTLDPGNADATSLADRVRAARVGGHA